MENKTTQLLSEDTKLSSPNSLTPTRNKVNQAIKKAVEEMERQDQDNNETDIFIPEDTIKKLKDLHKVFGLAVGILINSAISYLEFYLTVHNNLTIKIIVQNLHLDLNDKINNSKTIRKKFNLTWLTKDSLEKINMLDQIAESIIIGTELMYRHNYLFQPLNINNNEVNSDEQS